MVSGSDPSSGIPPHKPPGASHHAPGAHQKKSYKTYHAHGDKKGEFLGMPVTAKQQKQIYNNLSKMVIASIKDDQDRQTKALQNIKNAAEGSPLEPY